MAEHKQIKRKRQEESEEASRRRKQAHQSLLNQVEASDDGMVDFLSEPSPERHAALLAGSHSEEQLANLVRRLQQSCGNAYVQQVMERVQAEKGSGQPLEPQICSEMETAFNKDFGGVRIHTGTEADQLSKDLGAKSFTSAKDIFFREGLYKPRSKAGKGLLAHELAHLVQQENGAQPGQASIGRVGDMFEREAIHAGQAVTEGREVSVKSTSAVPALQRQAAEALDELPEAAAGAKTEALGVLQEVMAMLLSPRPDFGAIVAKLTDLLGVVRSALTTTAGGAMGALGGLRGRVTGAVRGMAGRAKGLLGGLFG